MESKEDPSGITIHPTLLYHQQTRKHTVLNTNEILVILFSHKEMTKENPPPYNVYKIYQSSQKRTKLYVRKRSLNIIHLYITVGLFPYIFTGENSGISLMHIKPGPELFATR